MTTPDLDAIRAHSDMLAFWELSEEPSNAVTALRAELAHDVPALLAEVVRLRAELDPDTHRDVEPWAQALFEQRDAALAELERVRSVVEKARAWRALFVAGPGRPVGRMFGAQEDVDLIAAVDAAYPPGEQT